VDRPQASSARVRNNMRSVRRKDTAPELAVRHGLFSRGLRYRVDYLLPIEGRRRRADVAFPGLKIAVFIDGCWWHGCGLHGGQAKTNTAWWRDKIASNIARDRDTDSRLRNIDWRVCRYWEHDDVTSVCDDIEQMVLRYRPVRSSVEP
jgi:DNA mismatch endonuclease, patch repair protein